MTAQTPGCGSNSEARKRGGEMWAIQRANPDAPVEVGEEVTITPITLGDIRAAERAADARTVADVLAEHEIRFPWGYRVDCTCDEWTGTPQFNEGTRMAQHRAHLADILAAAEQTRTDAARAEVKVAVEEWFTDVSLDDLFDVKGWRR